MPEPEGEAITRVIEQVEDAGEAAGDGARVTIDEIVENMGDRSFAPLLLTPALIVVSPLSGIFGVPTAAATVIMLIAVQMLIGRERPWLPGFIRNRSLPARRLRQAMGFLKTPVGWIDPLLKPRLVFLARRPASSFAILACIALAACMPPLEIVPMLGSVAAGAISLLAAGLLVRDGVLILLGYGVMAVGLWLVWNLLLGG